VRQAVLRKPFLDLGQLDRAVDLGVQAVDDVGARACGQKKPDPGQVVEILEALLVHRRHVGQGGRALSARHRYRAEPPRLDLRHRRRHGGARDLRLSGNRSGHGLRRLVGHVGDVDAGRDLDALHRKMRGRADARGCVGEFLLARERDQFLEVVRLHRRMHRDDVGSAGSQYDRREVP
jgi:hypothetical protein